MQSGITVSAELHVAFTRFNSDTLNLLSAASPQLPSVLQPKTPIYLLLRRPSDTSPAALIALTYIPSNAPVRAKTLFASTRSVTDRELGTEKFASTVFCY
ncbi:hypothetical protein N7471_010271 [Penicillium samsonianum]|uniref:uncharacterized protein n=1 Tax=Penicillium samsonianum TaxID=1882272 RepID=UPI002546ABC2|nr:uncharacterized protein N7471_010271 [Penicillium samsonianum]KAJ6129054.1 hypothetical protein N7471_010271 [Penicillium samsonianum]